MAEYRLSKAAKEDLMRIAQFGDENFGTMRSDQYRDRLRKRFAVLAAQPLLYPAVEHIRSGYRRSVCGAHSIYYLIELEGVKIMRVLGRQNAKTSTKISGGPVSG